MLSVITDRTTKLRFFLAIGAIGLLAFSIYHAQGQITTMTSPRTIIYDHSFIEISNQISEAVPDGEILVVSTLAPQVTFFSDHDTRIPWAATSKESLVSIMKSSDWNYLLVFENNCDVEGLKPLFSTNGLKQLNEDFDKLSSYSSDHFSIHLYKLRMVK